MVGLEVDCGAGLFIFYAIALAILWDADGGGVDLFFDEADGEEKGDDEEGEELHKDYDLLTVLQNCECHLVYN